MKSKFAILIAIALLMVMAIPAGATTIPTISIISIVQDQSITIQTFNFPANDTFNVTMGLSGTQGIGGVLVSRLTSGPGGSMLAKFQIPNELKGQSIIAIRLESPNYPYYNSYNWFYNTTAAGAAIAPYYPVLPTATSVPGSSHEPTGFHFDIINVVKGESVGVRLIYFPAARTFMVLMKNSSSLATYWYGVTEFNSADGGIFNATFSIPTQLMHTPMISIKIVDEGNGWFTYNLFNNANYP
jgi:hypothetical protein